MTKQVFTIRVLSLVTLISIGTQMGSVSQTVSASPAAFLEWWSTRQAPEISSFPSWSRTQCSQSWVFDPMNRSI